MLLLSIVEYPIEATHNRYVASLSLIDRQDLIHALTLRGSYISLSKESVLQYIVMSKKEKQIHLLK